MEEGTQRKRGRFLPGKLTSVIGLFFLLVVLLGTAKALQIRSAIKEGAKRAPPPPVVTTITVAEESWAESIRAVGSLAATRGVTLSAEVGGRIASVGVSSGESVTAGAVMLTIDPSVDEANLRGAVAKRDEARQILERAVKLRSEKAISQSDYDRALAQSNQAESEVQSLRALVEKHYIRAPFAAQTGIRLVNEGDYVQPGTPLIPLYVLDPLYVDFSIPQQSVPSLRPGLPIDLSVDAFPGKLFSATVTAINPQVDPITRTVMVQATAENGEKLLRPGMFAEVAVRLAKEERAITIPLSSISYAPYGDSVFVVERTKGADGVEVSSVRQQIVKLGAKRGNQVAVLSGLAVGDEVVTSGTFRLQPGNPVRVDNRNEKLAPKNVPAPEVSDN